MKHIGIIGLDSSHAIEFTRLINGGMRARVVAACRGAETGFPLSVSRRAAIERQFQCEFDLPILPSFAEMPGEIDAFMVLGCDGRCHAADAHTVIGLRKPVFIDKPLCANAAEARVLLSKASASGTPVYSASALRFRPPPKGIADFFSNAPLNLEIFVPSLTEPGHPDLSWHGIHGVEAGYAVLGAGCVSVERQIGARKDITIGVWKNGATLQVNRSFTDDARAFPMLIYAGEATAEATASNFSYVPLVDSILDFFVTRRAPVSEMEMLEVLAFIDAADASRDANGAPVSLTTGKII